MNKDTLHRFVFDNLDVRGEIAQLEQSYQQILAANNYPVVLQKILGELLVATSLLSATIKFSGDISVQLQGDGPVSLAVINGNSDLELRGVARWKGELVDTASLSELFGKGYMVITLTPTEGERYQGIVSLEHADLAACLEEYFNQSEQLPTQIKLFADGKQAAGMLLQVLPSDKDNNEDFEHLTTLTTTIKQQELFELPATEVLHRLYHEEDVRLFDGDSVTFKCSCSRERTSAALRTLAKTEVDSIIAQDGEIVMGCEYCSATYKFDAIDVAAIFADSPTTDTPAQ
ncbi:Hsp33 family molecular chaperone HslO [Shewanella sp. WXL01]|uniref:Hsp33 family molecular chaperone HslO n=1 Tax=Shewanella sp. WXL01 TaxID=2709721 RepID=UPI0014383749|nr:Hsp33 family molecular chaperone HslO [Shewanella sp. WXL01]NKF52508.1 Hsp33 family molecular chaperone HslO [Shewanella sp. WXL01]